MFEIKIIFFHIIAFFLVVILSRKLGFVDKPNERKVHNEDVVHTGGLVIYLTYFFILISLEINPQIEIIIATGSIIIFFGFFDDQYKLTPGIKLFFIFLPVLYLFYEGYYLDNLGKYKFIGILELNKFSLIFSFLSVGLLINAINYIDGSDGLCSSFLITCFLFFILFSENQNTEQLLIYMIIPLIINLVFNLLGVKSKFKIFLGNSGSLFFGFLISFLMIYLFKYEKIHPSYLIWVVWLPVYDFLFVNLNRFYNKVSIFLPRKDHVHHVMLFLFKNDHKKTLFILSVLNISIIFFGYSITKSLGDIYSLFAYALLFVIYILFRISLKKLKK